MAMGTFNPRRTGRLASLAVVAAICTLIVAIAAADGRRAITSSRGWRHATISSGAATLAYPPGWEAIPGDLGTLSFATRGRGGLYLGYLNATPRQGAEQLAGWGVFRTRRNSEDGDRRVRTLSSSENVPFIDARGSCVLDEYLSRVGSHPYRELACIVAGRRSTSVFVGAALVADWPALGPIVEHAAATFVER
jgi:hypothetical protein